ncbi:hypothetical protein [Streptomyces doebereineriae]|uniref:Uncharacterized protein n=1 Tax=Streptomyces doebereineriae TaxID=3075528 RepID=A0ABU2VBP0_9ACTN|nr:hypothetical protein [Streptomyces sp. DSM 41640]MDT0482367.1 hypothetical protein [Streptomyces sp. DSM 41640]
MKASPIMPVLPAKDNWLTGEPSWTVRPDAVALPGRLLGEFGQVPQLI